MAHIYMLFDFAEDEEKAQQARHKLEVWKQAFRLDKKLLYKFDRPADDEVSEEVEEKPAKTKGSSKSKKKTAKEDDDEVKAPVKLLVRLAFSGHEKLSEQRWIDRIPTEEPFQAASPAIIKANDAKYEETEKQFENLG
ncbi:MAG TPA: hypothetical protein VGF19_07185 [Candidatus Acidoferrum sp.]